MKNPMLAAFLRRGNEMSNLWIQIPMGKSYCRFFLNSVTFQLLDERQVISDVILILSNLSKILSFIKKKKRKILSCLMLTCIFQIEDPLSETTKYLKLLQKNSPDSMETHLLSFEVNMRRQKILLAFQVNLCLNTGGFTFLPCLEAVQKPTQLNGNQVI